MPMVETSVKGTVSRPVGIVSDVPISSSEGVGSDKDVGENAGLNSGSGRSEKNSIRAYVFRFAL